MAKEPCGEFVMLHLKKAVILSVMLLMTLHVPAARAVGTRAEGSALPAAAETEMLLDGHSIVNILDDVLAFWEAARGKGLRRARQMWIRMVENKHRNYFDRAVYRDADVETRRAMLLSFLTQLPERIDAIREFDQKASETVLEGIIDFKARFPEYRLLHDIYVGPSLLTFDGTVRPVHNRLNIPDTLCLGGEVLAGYGPDQLKIALAHEFFHLYHFGFLFRDVLRAARFNLQFNQEALARLAAAHVSLMVEGMAVAGSEAVYPDLPLAMYLHFTEEDVASQEEDLSQNSQRFLQMMKEGALPDQYEQWFTNAVFDGVPTRGGYLLGYEVTKRVLPASSLEEMVRMSSAQLGEHAEEQLSAMTAERVLLMAASR